MENGYVYRPILHPYGDKMYKSLRMVYNQVIMKKLILLLLFIFSMQVCPAQNEKPFEANNKSDQPKIFSEGIICTGDYETHPAFSPSGDTLYFLKCLPDANFCSICVSYNKNGKWSAPQVVPFSGKYVDADPFVTRDGNTLYFVSNRPVNEGDPAKEDWDIWKTERNSSGWGKPIHLDSPINSSGSEFFPTIADNGNFYFGSSRKAGKGRSDIYFSRFINNTYSAPENLGDSINTADNEYEAFIAPDESYLIFMATIPGGIANADFYISYNLNGKWTKAKKLPPPINSAATEWGGKVTRDGKYFFFGSSRNKINDVLPQRENMQQFEKRLNTPGNGLGDIYFVDFSALKLKQ